jgi:hypothetical protein
VDHRHAPAAQQPSFLTAADTAGPEAASDPAAASVILDSLTADISDLQSARLSSPPKGSTRLPLT